MKINDKQLAREYFEGKGFEEAKILAGTHFSEAVTEMLKAQDEGLKKYLIFNDHAYITGHLTEDSMYLDYCGCSKKEDEYHKSLFKIRKQYEHFYDCVLFSYLEESRKNGIMNTIPENIIAALKFIAENHNNDNGLVVSKALIDYGFNFERSDYELTNKVGSTPIERDVNMLTALSIVERYRDSVFGSRAVAKALLENDDEKSLYGFIRHLTGDETYTKEYADKVRANSDIAKISGEALYEMFTGTSKDGYEQAAIQAEEDHRTGKSDIMNAEELAASREKGIMPATMENVISGLKFIAEKTKVGSYNRYEVADQLIESGYNFKLDDIKGQYNEHGKYLPGMASGELAAGVHTIEMFRDSISASSYIEENLLGIDTDMSIYHYIRVVTGDESYTKEYVDSLKVGKGTK